MVKNICHIPTVYIAVCPTEKPGDPRYMRLLGDGLRIFASHRNRGRQRPLTQGSPPRIENQGFLRWRIL